MLISNFNLIKRELLTLAQPRVVYQIWQFQSDDYLVNA